MVRSKFNEHDKITFVGWVDKALDQSLIKHNIKAMFKWIGIWLLRTLRITRTEVKRKV
jgi:hypothetical protein